MTTNLTVYPKNTNSNFLNLIFISFHISNLEYLEMPSIRRYVAVIVSITFRYMSVNVVGGL